MACPGHGGSPPRAAPARPAPRSALRHHAPPMASHPLFANVRRSPYFDRTEAAGAVAYMAYNHMYMAMDYGRQPAAEYRALTEGVTLWDVGAERQVELAGPDALAFADRLVTRDLSALAPGACRYTLVARRAGHRDLRSRAPVRRGGPRLALARQRRPAAVGEGRRARRRPRRRGARGGRRADAGAGAARARPCWRRSSATRSTASRYYRLTQAEIAGVPCVVSRTGWSGGPGYEVFPLGSERALEVWDAVAAAGHAARDAGLRPERAARARARHHRHRVVPQPGRERARGRRAAGRPRCGRLRRPDALLEARDGRDRAAHGRA